MDWHGIEDSGTLDKYLHRDERRLKKKRLQDAGIELDEEENMFKAPVCPICDKRYGPDELYCVQCGMALTREAVEEKKQLEEAGETITEAQLNQGLTDEEIKEKKEKLLDELQELQDQVKSTG